MVLVKLKKEKLYPELNLQQDGFTETHQQKDRIWSLNSVTLVFTPFQMPVIHPRLYMRRGNLGSWQVDFCDGFAENDVGGVN